MAGNGTDGEQAKKTKSFVASERPMAKLIADLSKIQAIRFKRQKPRPESRARLLKAAQKL
jgi:hypothetical protein